MSQNFIDNNILQRALFALTDLIEPTVSSHKKAYELTTNYTGSIIKLGIDSTREINEEEEVKILRRQQELFSDSSVTSPELASAVFKNNETSNPKDLEYFITNNIVIFIGDIPFYFNVDTVNYDNKKFFISTINIKNQSKEAFTSKSNYKITLNIHFTEFDDLLEKSIRVTMLSNPQYIEYIAPLQLLYKYFDYNTNQFGKSLGDGNGIYFCQILRYLDGTEANKILLQDIGESELVKNYHVGYMSHRFEMFKNEEPIFKYFENELIIEYAAYEADGEEKPISKEIAKYLPKSSGNLYNMINDDKYLKAPTEFNKYYSEGSFKSLKETIKMIEGYNNLIVKKNNILNCKDKNIIDDDKKKELRLEIKNIKDDIIDLKRRANLQLFFYILDDIFIYELTMKRENLGVYEVGNFAEAFWENFSVAGVLSTVAASAPEAFTGTLATGATALGTASLVGIGIYGGYALVSAMLSRKIESTNITVDFLRESYISYGKVSVHDPLPNVTASGTKGIWSEITRAKGSFNQIIGGEIVSNDERTKGRVEAIQKATLLEAEEQDVGGDVKILFTTFGDILDLISRVNTFKESVNYMIGGYIFDIDPANLKSKYVNFYNLPVTLYGFVEFLRKQILDTDRNFKYDTDVFFRDCYVNLVQNILKDGNIIMESVRKTTPKLISIASTIHKKSSSGRPNWFNDLNLLDDQKYKDFKLNFLKSKNLNFSKGLGNDSLYKIYFIGTQEELKYYDFYDKYAEWAVKPENGKANKRFMYNVLEFQEFINKEHLLPSILMKNVSDSESILKKKYVAFQRLDNVNLETGNVINGSGVLRKPYQFAADFKINMSFFCDIGSYIFISPPISELQVDKNMFGFGGLYVIKGAELTYQFQKIVDGNIKIPNLESKYTMTGVMVTHGDALINTNNKQTKDVAEKIDPCSPTAIKDASAPTIYLQGIQSKEQQRAEEYSRLYGTPQIGVRSVY